jgi:hypothetical protein
MYDSIPMAYGIPMAYEKTQIQTLTHGYQDFFVFDVFQAIRSKLVQDMEYVMMSFLSS